MDNLSNMMRADSKQLVKGEPDLSVLLGTWVNTNPETDYISKLTIDERNGIIVVRAFGAYAPELIDWGEAEATAYVTGGTLEGVGFLARYVFGESETFLAAIHKLGILVIQSYTSFKDASGRMNHFGREFYHR